MLCMVCIACLIISCDLSSSRGVKYNAFYYWKGSFYMNGSDISRLKELDVRKLYLKYFDVAYNATEGPHPEGQIFFSSAIPDSFEIVPVVFITNQCFVKSDSDAVVKLATRVVTRLKKEIQRTQTGVRVKEIQIDCDWTKSTRDKYFYFLSTIRSYQPYAVSATIRLHQYKYHKNNLPPVDRGLLMCYNVDQLDDPETANSLFSKDETMKYIRGVKYPLPLDVAFPVFSWGIEFNQASFEGIANGITSKLLNSTPAFVKTDKPGVYRCTRDTFLFNHYFDAGNSVRVEEVDFEDLKQVSAYLKHHIPNDTSTIILFHYDNELINDGNQQEISALFASGH